MADSEGPPRQHRSAGLLFAIEATPGVWIGLAGLVLVIVAAALPWYTISAQVAPVYPNKTTIIQFDGINGLYVEPNLKTYMGWDPPAVGFPLVIMFALSALLKARKLLRSTTHKMRSATLFRSSLTIIIPIVITIVVITQIPSFVPDSAPAEVRVLADGIGSQPLGGARQFVFNVTPVPLGPTFTVPGEIQWGFGPALWVMIGAAALLNIGSKLELHAFKKKHEELMQSQGQA